MDNESISMWELVWSLVTLIATIGGASGAIYCIWKYVIKYSWQLRWWDKHQSQLMESIPHRTALRKMNKLVKHIGRIQIWTMKSNIDIDGEILCNLNKLMWYIRIELWPCAAIYSTSDDEKRLALRNLSQAENKDSIKRYIKLVDGVCENPYYSASVKEVAKAVLRELRKQSKAS